MYTKNELLQILKDGKNDFNYSKLFSTIHLQIAGVIPYYELDKQEIDEIKDYPNSEVLNFILKLLSKVEYKYKEGIYKDLELELINIKEYFFIKEIALNKLIYYFLIGDSKEYNEISNYNKLNFEDIIEYLNSLSLALLYEKILLLDKNIDTNNYEKILNNLCHTEKEYQLELPEILNNKIIKSGYLSKSVESNLIDIILIKIKDKGLLLNNIMSLLDKKRDENSYFLIENILLRKCLNINSEVENIINKKRI